MTEGCSAVHGWAELHQTGGAPSHIILLGEVCFTISKTCPISGHRPPINGPLPKHGFKNVSFVPKI